MCRGSSVGIVTGSMDGVRLPVGARDFYVLHSVQTVLEPAMHPIKRVSGVKQSGREADNIPPFRFEVKNCGAVPPLTLTSSWHSS
jgi:hypothetical protein